MNKDQNAVPYDPDFDKPNGERSSVFAGASPKLTLWFGLMTGLAVMSLAVLIVVVFKQ